MDNNKSKIPQNDPSKPMDSKREVDQSNDNKIDQDFPGYPHYPAKEDIMGVESGNHRVDLDVENVAAGPNSTGLSQRYVSEQEQKNSLDVENEVENTEVSPAGPSSRSGNPDVRNDEISVPQNVSNDDLNKNRNLPGTDMDEAKQ